MSLTKVTNSMILGAYVNVLDYGTNTVPGTTNMAPAINAAIVAAGEGGTVFFPKGTYNTTSPILAENLSGLTLLGEIATASNAGTAIIGTHTGKCILSLVGSRGVVVNGLALYGAATTYPKTGLLLGRSSAASAGNHVFYNIGIRGNFSVAAVYNVASEDVCFFQCFIFPTLSPIAAASFSQTDYASIGGLTGSSMETVQFYGGYLANSDATAGSTCLYLPLGSATGHHLYNNVFFSKNGGSSYIKLAPGAVDGSSSVFPIQFNNPACEPGATSPTTCFEIVAGQGGLSLGGLTINNLWANSSTGYTNLFTCDTSFNTSLVAANISFPNNVPGAVSIGNMKGSRFSTLGTATAVITTAQGCDLLGSVTVTNNLGGNTTRNVAGGQFLLTGPVFTNTKAVITASTYSQNVTDSTLIFSGASSNCTLTLQAPSNVNGVILNLLNYSGTYSVVSATANITPLAGGPATTSILPVGAGKWCTLQSDGVSWSIIQSN
jgi:hypothetical protein